MPPLDESLLPSPLPPERRGWRSGDLVRAATIALAVWFGMQLFWSVRSLVILVFLATLFGLAVGRGVDYLERFRIRRGIASALIVLTTLGGIFGVLSLTAPTLLEQGKQLQREFPEAIGKVQQWIDSRRGGLMGTLIEQASGPPTSPAADSTAASPTPPGTRPAPGAGSARPAGAATAADTSL
uniref:AI-2E family transporter n=1 Tax=Gemmatimonas sp. UBA7669 TaxID=1946568 RepID=UPI0025C59299